MPLPKGFTEAAAQLPPPAKAPERPAQGRGGERGTSGGRNYGPKRDGEGGNRRRRRPGGGGGRSGGGGRPGGGGARVGAHKDSVKRVG